MSWTQQRKKFVTFIILLFIFIIIGIIAMPIVFKAPTCFDGSKNGTETNVDCGGVCSKVCESDILPLEIQWQRSIKVDDGLYDAIGYLVNKNNNATPTQVTFKATLSDKNGATIAIAEGGTVALPGSATPLYLPNIKVGEAIPVRTRFELTEVGSFYNYSNRDTLKNLQVVEQSFDNKTSTSKLNLTIENKSFDLISDIDVYVLLYDKEDTLVAVNKTYIKNVPAKTKEKAYFSWRNSITTPTRFEFILVQNPFEK